MSSIRSGLVALDTNVYIFALRPQLGREHCERLVYDVLSELRVFIPLQVELELQRNLTGHEFSTILVALERALQAERGLRPADSARLEHWVSRGAKKGDAVIVAQLEAVGARFLVSENRHFLSELRGLPFAVLTSEEAIALLLA